MLITVGVATTFGAAIPFGYNIGVINSPAKVRISFSSVPKNGREKKGKKINSGVYAHSEIRSFRRMFL